MAALKLLALDVDGVLTDGRLYYTADGEAMKAFHAQDGLGLQLLKQTGVEIVVISGRDSPALRRRLSDLGIVHLHLGVRDKVAALQATCTALALSPDACAYMGDDLIDLCVMQHCGYAIAPADACGQVLEVADFVTKRGGGRGAVRDAVEHLAEKAGHDLLAVAGSAFGWRQ